MGCAIPNILTQMKKLIDILALRYFFADTKMVQVLSTDASIYSIARTEDPYRLVLLQCA
jgi:hypothetical protein